MTHKISILLLGFLFLISCKSRDLTPANQLCVQVKDTRLVLTNQSDTSLYYAVFEQESLALLNWTSVCSTDNQLQNSKSVTLSLASIYGYKPNATVVVYWWQCTDTTPKTSGSDLKHILIPTNAASTICAKAH